MRAACVLGLGMVMGVMWAAAAPEAGLSARQKAAIGRQVWQNECAGSVTGLTSWNGGEEFPSLGIGHFIWYPAGFNGRFTESWPAFVAYARRQGAEPPAVALERHCPWPTKAEFQKDFNGPRLSGLRAWLADHVALQTDFIITRSREALPKILAAAPASERSRIEANYHKVAAAATEFAASAKRVLSRRIANSPPARGEKRWLQGWHNRCDSYARPF